MFGKKQLLSSVAIAVAFSTSGSIAFAVEEDENGPGLEEVVVTSRKTEENILDVPLAITVFDANAIESAGIDNIGDVAALTPGLNFFNPIGESLATPIIRGVAQTDIFGETNTAVFVDGVYVSSRSAINMSQLDIARIEVIKGPQSAMYGRNAFSGAINVVTAAPSDEISGKITGTIGNDGKYSAMASVSGPIVDGKVSGRLSISYDTFDGSYDNAVENGPNIGGHEFKTINGSLLFTPNENFSALLMGYYSDDRIDNSALSAVGANCEDRGDPGGRFQNFCGVLPSIDKGDLFIQEGATGQEREVTRFSAKLEWESDIGTFESLTGYSKVNTQINDDFDRGDDGFDFVYLTTDGFFFSIPGFADFFGTGLMRTDTFKVGLLDAGGRSFTKDFSQEFRFSTPVEDSIRASVGVFYYNSKSAADDGGAILASGTIPDDFFTLGPWVQFNPFGPGLEAVIPVGDAIFADFLDFSATKPDGVFSDDSISKEESISGFGYVEADLAENLVGRVEVRYASDKKSFRNDRVLDPDITVNCSSSGGVFACNKTWNSWTTRLSFEYHPNDNWLLFATAAKGSKPGGFDTAEPISGGSVVLSSFDPESNWTYEIGAKGRMMDGRLIAELSVYYIDWDNIVVPQVVDVELPGGGAALPASVNANAGTAKVTGAEFSAQALLTEDFRVNVGVSYANSRFTDAQVDSFVEFPSFAPDGDVSGNKLLRQPKWQFNISPMYETQVSEDVAMFIRADIMHEGQYFVGNTNQAIIPGRTKVNARTGVRLSSGLEVEFWVDNLFDDDKPDAAFRDVFLNNTADGVTTGFNAIFPWRMSVLHPRLRTFGVTARYKF